ncbi:MAG: TauD/TfdA family dioxygenase [Sphingomonas bacterium]|nr:TauD/TfdA family dioxygenase [Sphingomonas bacterium]
MIEGFGDTSPMAVDAALVEQQFRNHGALLLRGFEFDVGTFRLFAERLCKTSVFNESPNRALLDAESNIQSVDLGVDPFPLHPELSREPWRPDACLFACFSPPGGGGETTVCDGVEIVKRLPPPLVAEIRRRRLVYLQPASPEVLEYWLGTATPDARQLASPPSQCPYFFRDTGGRVIRGFSRPLLHKPMFHEGPAFGNFLLFARDFLRVPNFPRLDDGQPVPDEWVDAVREAAAPLTHALAWRRGDILILDNSRFMHGRRAIADPGERKIASYFGYVGFAPPNDDDPIDPPWRSGQFKPPAVRRRG